jgi:hypothetical protein
MGTTQQAIPLRRLKLALVFEVGQAEGKFLGSPHVVDGRDALPIIHLLREVLGCKDSCQGHHHKFDIGDGHASPLCLLLSIFHHDNELGDAICLDVVLGHVQGEGDHVDGMQPPAVGIKVGRDFEGRNLCIESLGTLQVVVPNLVNNNAEEFGDATFGCFIAGVVVKVGFVGGLGANMANGRGVISNGPVVEGEAGRSEKLGGDMVGFVLGGLYEDGRERMDSFQLVI